MLCAELGIRYNQMMVLFSMPRTSQLSIQVLRIFKLLDLDSKSNMLSQRYQSDIAENSLGNPVNSENDRQESTLD